MNRFILGLVFYATLCGSAKAQSLKGTVIDEADNTPLPGVTVALNKTVDSTTAYTSVTNKSGAFIFESVIPGDYSLVISSIGYELLRKPISVADTSIDIGTILIAKAAKVLSTVTINTTAPPVRQKVDTLEYSSNAFKVN